MAQKSQIVDLRKSYIPGDPNAIHQNMVNTDREDREEQTLPIVPYEGYNFLPTSYGYRSYFGTTGYIDLAPLNSRVQHIIAFQLPNFKQHYIALAEDGIWISQENKTWLQAKIHTFSPSVFEEWTFCFIENVLYMYQQGKPVIYKTSWDLSYTLSIAEITPSFLTMAGQMGIFKAGTRLGMWDSEGSISWSSTFDFSDFTPSLETLAGNTKFNAVTGKIVTVKDHGEGFIIYSTKSIVSAQLHLQGNMLWDSREVFANIGISHPLSVASGAGDAEHYAYTNAGIYRIGKYSGAAGTFDTERVFPEIFDFLRESRQPVLLQCIHKRFLHFILFDDRYISEAISSISQASNAVSLIAYPNNHYQITGHDSVGILNRFNIPATSFIPNIKSSAFSYNTAKGALVWDLHLKKWGKFKADFSFLVDHIAYNIPAYNQFTYTDLGMTAGPFIAGRMRLFDDIPSEGFIRYGKLGYYRLGMTHLLETRIDFRRPAKATITIESSLDGRTLEPVPTFTANAFQVNTLTMFPNIRYRWHTVKIEGQWDIQYMEVRANNIAARR